MTSLTIPPVSSKPLILLLHGAWHVPQHYHKLISALESAGFPVLCPPMPSCNDACPPTKNLDDDVQFTRDIAKQSIAKGHEIVALMHSWGGMVGSNALAGLKVKVLVYMSAFMPFAGESIAGIFGGGLPPFLVLNQETKCIDISNPEMWFYQDLSVEEQKWAVGLLVRHSIECQHEGVRRKEIKEEIGEKMAWADEGARVCYLVCTEDTALPPDGPQRMMIERVEKKGGLGEGKVEVWDVVSGHSPFLRCPERVVECLQEIVG